jgi:hypothetical protein
MDTLPTTHAVGGADDGAGVRGVDAAGRLRGDVRGGQRAGPSSRTITVVFFPMADHYPEVLAAATSAVPVRGIV